MGCSFKLKKSNRKPEKIWVDKSREFTKLTRKLYRNVFNK